MPDTHTPDRTAVDRTADELQVWINHEAHTLPRGATLADAVRKAQVQAPFAAAVNLHFVPRSRYDAHALQDQDRIELISPITGG
jgi:sulfur carrier protein